MICPSGECDFKRGVLEREVRHKPQNSGTRPIAHRLIKAAKTARVTATRPDASEAVGRSRLCHRFLDVDERHPVLFLPLARTSAAYRKLPREL